MGATAAEPKPSHSSDPAAARAREVELVLQQSDALLLQPPQPCGGQAVGCILLRVP